jgi:hypothetical protein
MIASRPGNLSHAQALLYEMDLFRETARQLEVNKWQGDFHKWIVLESFLLHFRNLVEFFGRPDSPGHHLSIKKPESFWPDTATRPADPALARLHRQDLWTKYEGPANPQSISKYLHHCTRQRTEAKDWNISEMYNEISGTLDEFERLLPDKAREWPQPKAQPGFDLLAPVSPGSATGN